MIIPKSHTFLHVFMCFFFFLSLFSSTVFVMSLGKLQCCQTKYKKLIIDKMEIFQRAFVCLVRKINVICSLFVLGLQKNFENYYKQTNKNLYNKLEVGLHPIFNRQICSTKILRTLLKIRSRTENKTNTSDRGVAIKAIMSLLCLSVLVLFFNTNPDLKQHL